MGEALVTTEMLFHARRFQDLQVERWVVRQDGSLRRRSPDVFYISSEESFESRRSVGLSSKRQHTARDWFDTRQRAACLF